MPRLCAACLLSFVAFINGSAAEYARATSDPPIAPLADIIDRLKRAYDHMPCEYTGVRHYTLRNKRFGKSAEMSVLVTYRRREGKSFKVLETRGSDDIQRRVFQKLLDAEVEASQTTKWNARVTPENYNFRMVRTERLPDRWCYVVHISPKVKSKYLIEGDIWVDATDYGIVRMDGKPSESISFWIGKPHIDQQFEKIGDFWLASHNRSRADSRLLGASELNIEYGPYQLDRGKSSVASTGNSSRSNTGAHPATQ